MTVTAETVLALSAVRFAWPGATAPVVAIESFSLSRGERIFLRGPSGSGKSTLLNLIAGVLTPQQGTITVMGQATSSMSGAARDRFRADHIGYIFQMFNLIPYLSVIENVALPCLFSDQRRGRALASAESLDSEARRLVGALDLAPEVLGRAVTQLSVGQQQRVAAARALIGAPDLVIADEPTSALDADRRTAFLDLLFRQCEADRTALVFASHDASLASLFDRTIHLDSSVAVKDRQ